MAKEMTDLAPYPDVDAEQKRIQQKNGQIAVVEKRVVETLPLAVNVVSEKYVDIESQSHAEKIRKPFTVCFVVHAIRGRLRFRVPKLKYNEEYAYCLTVLLEAESLVKEVRINRAAASVAIAYEASGMSDPQMRSRLEGLIQLASTKKASELQPKAVEEEEEKTDWWASLKLPILATSLTILRGTLGFSIPGVLIGGTIAIATLPVAERAWESIKDEGKLNIDFLDLTAIIISTCQGQFLAPALMLTLIELGETIRDATARSTKRKTLDLLDSLSSKVWVERNCEKQEIPISEVQHGDTVIVYPGDQIPVDGRVLRGKALVDQQKLTGESIPVMRSSGQEVLASTLVREGQIYILVLRVGSETRAGQSIKLIQEAPIHDTRMENYAAKLANKAVMPTLLLGLGVFAVTRNLARAASVLTLDFATGVRVSVPTTVLAALTYAARRGVLIRSGRALEKLAEVDIIVFDKTGTLTLGEVAVVNIETVHLSISGERLLSLAASAEQRLTHPVAEAIVRYALEQETEILPRGEWDYEIGLGVSAIIDGQRVLVGSDRFLRSSGIQTPEQHQPGSWIYVASNGEFLGSIEYSDQLRPESQEVVAQLQAKNLDIHMLSGDNRNTAAAVASVLGIPPTHTHAEAFPEQKAEIVRQLHTAGKTVAFVGDGINDSPALAYADVSVSFASGSEIARETADVVLMENDLRSLVEAISIANEAKQIIYENTGIVVVPNLTALIIAATVGLSPLAATVVNNGSSVVAGLNGLRPILMGHQEKSNSK